MLKTPHTTSILLTLAFVFGMSGCSSAAQSSGGRTAINPGGLFSQSVRSGQIVFLSGMIGRDGPDGVQGATRGALDSVQGAVEAAGGTMADIVQCTVYMTDMEQYGEMNEAYGEYWPSEPPARTAIAISEVPAGAILEIACIAAVP